MLGYVRTGEHAAKDGRRARQGSENVLLKDGLGRESYLRCEEGDLNPHESYPTGT